MRRRRREFWERAAIIHCHLQHLQQSFPQHLHLKCQSHLHLQYHPVTVHQKFQQHQFLHSPQQLILREHQALLRPSLHRQHLPQHQQVLLPKYQASLRRTIRRCRQHKHLQPPFLLKHLLHGPLQFQLSHLRCLTLRCVRFYLAKILMRIIGCIVHI